MNAHAAHIDVNDIVCTARQSCDAPKWNFENSATTMTQVSQCNIASAAAAWLTAIQPQHQALSNRLAIHTIAAGSRAGVVNVKVRNMFSVKSIL